VKGDPKRAEEYYSRAMLADPSDGEIMSQYAKLAWEAHHDRERSLRYFHKSVQAAPQNRSRCSYLDSFTSCKLHNVLQLLELAR
jgi:Tfp pilus assembly protein PilF